MVYLIRVINKKKHEEFKLQAQLAGMELKDSVNSENEISDDVKEHAKKIREKIAKRGNVHAKG